MLENMSLSICMCFFCFFFGFFFGLFVLCYSGLFLSNLVVIIILDASLNSNGKEKERKTIVVGGFSLS